jgi:hypothetical protein
MSGLLVIPAKSATTVTSFFIKSISGLLLLSSVLPFANRSKLPGLKPFFLFYNTLCNFKEENSVDILMLMLLNSSRINIIHNIKQKMYYKLQSNFFILINIFQILTKMGNNKQMSDFTCESHNLSLQKFVIDDNQCLVLVNCHECNSQLRQIWTHTATEKVEVNGYAEKEEDLSASNLRYDKPEQYFKRYVTNHVRTSVE